MSFVAEQRHKHILRIAGSHLSASEAVLAWARARSPRTRAIGLVSTGFVYATPEKLLVYWAGQAKGHSSIPWPAIRSWGVKREVKGGPILGIETKDEVVYVQLTSKSRPSAHHATEFLRVFADRAPKVRKPLAQEFRSERSFLEVSRARRSLAGHTWRIVATIVGSLFTIVGILGLVLPVLPGWLFLIPGLAILASEYDWAQDLLAWVKEKYRRTKQKIRERRQDIE